MVTLRGRPVGSSGAGEGSGSGSGTGQLDDKNREFISSDITHCILEQTPVIFGLVKEGILEILDERLSSFHSEVMALVGSYCLTFKDLWACEAIDYHGEKDPIMSRRWLADVANAFYTNSFPDKAKVRIASYLFKDRA